MLSASIVRVSKRFDLYFLYYVLRSKERSGRRCPEAYVRTLYKRKDKKVRSVDLNISDGSISGGFADWKNKISILEASEEEKNARFEQWFKPKFLAIARGSRLTPERLVKI